MTLLIVYIVLAIGVSFLCSILEAVFLSITPSYIAALEKEDAVLAGKLRALKANVDRPLSAILSLNTVAHTVGATGAGAQAAVVFGDTAVGIFSAILTFLILVLSEIIPKTLGALYWKSLSGFVARVLPSLIWAMYPLVKMSELITKLLSSGSSHHAISREEIVAMTDVGQRAGIVDEKESTIVRNLLRFDSLKVKDIMTPRTVVYALQADTLIGDVVENAADMRFSRIPIFLSTRDEVSGFVLKNDLLLAGLKGQGQQPVSSLRRELLSVPQSMPLGRLFQDLLENDRHIALVVDDYGGTAGVVTLEDVVETLLGMEIVDEADTVQDLQVLARKKWKERAGRMGLELPNPPNDA